MHIHYFQHVHFEGLGCIENWIHNNEYSVSATRFYKNNYRIPHTSEYDWLIVMGGPMSVHDESDYEWLAEEKQAIRKAIQQGKVVLGICFGAQLIAEALGANVSKNLYKEIGWHPIQKTPEGKKNEFFNFFPPDVKVFHWHSETFSLPKGTTGLAKSSVCKNQAFCYGDKVLGLQFHFEAMPETVQAITENCSDDIDYSMYVQNAREMNQMTAYHCESANEIMYEILERLASAYDKANDYKMQYFNKYYVTHVMPLIFK